MGVPAVSVVVCWAVALCVVDLRERRLPNVLTLPGAAVMLIGATLADRGLPALLGGAGLGCLYLVVHLTAPTAMGAGDVKLALGLGALTGAFGIDVWAIAAFGAPLLTAVAGLARGRGGAIPHGPAMCLASLVAVASMC